VASQTRFPIGDFFPCPLPPLFFQSFPPPPWLFSAQPPPHSPPLRQELRMLCPILSFALSQFRIFFFFKTPLFALYTCKAFPPFFINLPSHQRRKSASVRPPPFLLLILYHFMPISSFRVFYPTPPCISPSRLLFRCIFPRPPIFLIHDFRYFMATLDNRIGFICLLLVYYPSRPFPEEPPTILDHFAPPSCLILPPFFVFSSYFEFFDNRNRFL